VVENSIPTVPSTTGTPYTSEASRRLGPEADPAAMSLPRDRYSGNGTTKCIESDRFIDYSYRALGECSKC